MQSNIQAHRFIESKSFSGCSASDAASYVPFRNKRLEDMLHQKGQKINPENAKEGVKEVSGMTLR